MKWAYRRKDYCVPRSMKEAYGYDETYEPEIRCCSELFYERSKSLNFVLPTTILITLALLAAFFIFLLNK